MEPECDQHFRESPEELSWPVMARALRQYLTRVAEDDGALIRNRLDALEELPRSVKPSTKRVRNHRERLRRARVLSTATTVGTVAPSCNSGRTIQSLVEIKLFAELLPISTLVPHPTTAKCVNDG